MEYKFVSEESGTKLEEAVNELMAAGWVPIGGVSVAVLSRNWQNNRKGYEESETEWVYAQAMTRTAEQVRQIVREELAARETAYARLHEEAKHR